ncbi:phosphoribosylglycinamide formyltransferase [Sulfurovum sp. NBC37-1]|uniref:phosphoribosylglycinamide formyltransferase n=1 Tax=Sulfurovum sp. (strain NBC37-1) TaxID=387093 RepID=UPI0001587456|nr:phosphoribosylglycinamide formyltransferase [Sulfurovum sp. NBC37-1]BAF71119.1 phosphoribosylglycinamide formyltransferase [Sulfurovum sp. NBC37-1]
MVKRKKIAVLFSGKGSNFAHIVNTLHPEEAEVVVALTNNPEAGGIAVAKKEDIPLEIVDSKAYESREAFDTEVINRLQCYAPDLTVLAGFMRILTPVFTEHVKSVNLHPSLLPRHKGLNAIEKSYNDSYDEGGVSVHWVTSELDGGEIILQKKVSKEGLDFEQYDRTVRQIEKEALIEAIRKVL